MIVHRMMPDGAFIAGDTETKLTDYILPDSPIARAAQVNPEMTAEILTGITSRLHLLEKYGGDVKNRRNWELLNAGKDTTE